MACSRVIAAMVLCAGVLCALGGVAAAEPLGTAFTYQGELRDGDALANGVYDLRFRLYADAAGVTPIGPVLCQDNVEVVDGRFTVVLDAGAVFAGDVRYLEVNVRLDTGAFCASGGGYTTLLPRQRIAAAPNANFATSAASATTANTATSATSATSAITATNATALNNQPATFYTNAGNLTGTLSDARLSGNVTTLAGAQTFSGAKTFIAAPAFNAAGGGAPFTVSNTTKVTNLNADLLDGFDASSFAAAAHTHDAGAIVSGLLNDARLSTNIPRLSGANVFSGVNRFNAFVGVNRGAALTPNEVFGLQNVSGGTGYTGMYITSTDAVGGRPFYGYSVNNLTSWTYLDQSGFWRLDNNGTRMSVSRTTGNVGIGATDPSSRLEVQGSDPAIRVRNINDSGGGFIVNIGSTLQLGMYNPAASTWGVIPSGASRSLLGLSHTGRVGTLTNDIGAAAFRNTIDDGAGNAQFAGNISANNMPAIKFVTSPASGFFRNNSVTLIESVPVNVPADGFLRITARCRVFISAYEVFNSTATLELKETTSGEVTIKAVPLGIAGGAPTPSGANHNGDITLEHVIPVTAGTRTFKLRLLHAAGSGVDGVSYSNSEMTVMYFAEGL